MTDKNRRNYYRVLHVQPDAPAAVIRSSYRALMLKLEMHPDHGGEHWSAAILNEAYAVLSDPKTREAYDRALELGWDMGRGARSHRGAEIDAGRCVFCGARVHPVATTRTHCATCRSPLTLARKIDLGSPNRRSVDRIVRSSAVRYYVEWPGQTQPGSLRDLSTNGLSFHGSVEVAEYQILKIEALPVTAIVRVAYCGRSGRRELPYTIGAEFYTAEFRRTTGTFVSTRV